MDKDLNILLVEDNPGDAFLVKFYLEESIFKTAQFIHAEFMKSALDILSKNKIDVVLLDLNLPDSKGLETVERILEEASTAVVIVLTGLADNELGVQTVKLGAQDFLVKGQFDGKVLTSSIRYAFERAQLKQRVRELDDCFQQFTETQELANLGFLELDTQSNELKLSAYFYELLDLKDDKINHLEGLKGILDTTSASKLLEAVKSSIDTKQGFSLELKFKDNNDAFNLKTKFRDAGEILVGIVQKV